MQIWQNGIIELNTARLQPCCSLAWELHQDARLGPDRGLPQDAWLGPDRGGSHSCCSSSAPTRSSHHRERLVGDRRARATTPRRSRSWSPSRRSRGRWASSWRSARTAEASRSSAWTRAATRRCRARTCSSATGCSWSATPPAARAASTRSWASSVARRTSWSSRWAARSTSCASSGPTAASSARGRATAWSTSRRKPAGACGTRARAAPAAPAASRARPPPSAPRRASTLAGEHRLRTGTGERYSRLCVARVPKNAPVVAVVRGDRY